MIGRQDIASEIRRRGWRVECRRPPVNNPADVYVVRIFPSTAQDAPVIGLGMARESMEAAIADAYRSARETYPRR